MKRTFVVHGADSESGVDIRLELEATDVHEAETQAYKMGILVSHIEHTPAHDDSFEKTHESSVSTGSLPTSSPLKTNEKSSWRYAIWTIGLLAVCLLGVGLIRDYINRPSALERYQQSMLNIEEESKERLYEALFTNRRTLFGDHGRWIPPKPFEVGDVFVRLSHCDIRDLSNDRYRSYDQVSNNLYIVFSIWHNSEITKLRMNDPIDLAFASQIVAIDEYGNEYKIIRHPRYPMIEKNTPLFGEFPRERDILPGESAKPAFVFERLVPNVKRVEIAFPTEVFGGTGSALFYIDIDEEGDPTVRRGD